MRTVIGFFVVALLLAYGCSDDNNSTSGDGPVDLTGHSLGVAVVTEGTAYPPNTSFPILFDLVQSGATVTGEYSTADADTPTSGTVAGTISGRTFAFTLTENVPCSGTFTGSASVPSSGISFSGLYSGADCSGTTEAGFAVSK
jgi:hypothetical protein